MTTRGDPAARPEWVRYRLSKGKTVLTFRVPKGTPMVMEQAGWDVEGAVIDAAAAPAPTTPPAPSSKKVSA